METAIVLNNYRETSDASSFYHERTGGFGYLAPSSADCGNIADYTKNSTFLVQQTVHTPILMSFYAKTDTLATSQT